MTVRQADLFAVEPVAPLAGFWATQIAQHVVEMASITDAPRAYFAHSPVTLFGVEVMMHIGPASRRGISPSDWNRILVHLQEHGAETADLAVFSFGVLQPSESRP